MSDEWVEQAAIACLAATEIPLPSGPRIANFSAIIRTAHAPFREKVVRLVEAVDRQEHHADCPRQEFTRNKCECGLEALVTAARVVWEAMNE